MTLEEKIIAFVETKKDLDALDKVVKGYNAEIKTEMGNTDVVEAGDYVAKKSVTTKDKLLEDKMISYVKDHTYHKEGVSGEILLSDPTLGILKTKEYIDTDALEDAIYKGIITDEMLTEMANCFESTTVTTLRVTKRKK